MFSSYWNSNRSIMKFLKIGLILYFIWECLPACIYVHKVYAKPKKGIRFAWNWSYRCMWVTTEWNSGPLQVLLTTESSLQPLTMQFLNLLPWTLPKKFLNSLSSVKANIYSLVYPCPNWTEENMSNKPTRKKNKKIGCLFCVLPDCILKKKSIKKFRQFAI